MPSLDAEIDRLYQLPLAEFTAARNALARRLGKPGAAVKKLQKPNIAAWAVNQLYWRQRRAYARLLAAGDRRRAAHARLLSGKGGDVTAAEAAHEAALKEAMDEVRDLLRAAGDSMSAATFSAVRDTLQGLPGSEDPGRLTESLKPMGLEALAGLVPTGARTFAQAVPPVRPAAAVASATSMEPTAKQLAAAARRADAARRKEIAALQEEIRQAKRAERQTDAALKSAHQSLERAQGAHERLRDQVQFALKQIQDCRDEVAERDRERRDAGSQREQLEARLGGLRC